MNERRSIAIEGLSHLTAIPVASRTGPLLASSVIAPFDPGTRDVPESIDAQLANIFSHVDQMLVAAGGEWRHIAKMEFWVPNAAARSAIDVPWVERFPDPDSRPARHTHMGGGMNITASFLAWIGD